MAVKIIDMKNIDRLLSAHHADKKSLFLFGPRGTGKTNWVRSHYPNALYIDLLNAKELTQLQINPARLAPRALAHKDHPIIIDEVQRIPSLLDEVHRLIEHHGCTFILTGSSSRKLKRTTSNLLAGRALTYHMHPFTAIELGEHFDLNSALHTGLLPSLLTEPDAVHYLASYVETYLKEEVLQEGLIRNMGAFNRFMEVASFSQGSPINLSSISRDVGTNYKLISTYFEILEDLLIGVRIPSFTKRAKRRVIQHPKFYYFDTGVYRHLRPSGPLDDPGNISGIAFETLFMQHCRAYIDYAKLPCQLYFWRTTTGTEVDFIVYGDNGLFAFELKHRDHVKPKDFTGLKAFKKEYPMAQCYLVHAGEEKAIFGDITSLPIKEALLTLPEILTSA